MIKISIVLATTAMFAALLIAYPFSPSASSHRHHAHKPVTAAHAASHHRKPGVPRRAAAAVAHSVADADAQPVSGKPES